MKLIIFYYFSRLDSILEKFQKYKLNEKNELSNYEQETQS